MRTRRLVRSDVPVSRPGDARERQADALAARWGAPPARVPDGRSDGQPLSDELRRWAESRFSHDFSRVRIYTGDEADAEVRALDARALTLGDDIAFARGEATPSLVGHELAHVALGRAQPLTLHRKTKGEDVVDKARADWLDPDASVKADVDVIKVAHREVKKGKSVEFNRKAIKKKLASALTTLGKPTEIAAAEAECDALVDQRAKAATKGYKAKEKTFFGRFDTPLAALSRRHPKAQTKYWLKNTPSQVLDEIFAAADSDMPADQLYAYAMKEGLTDYVRAEAGVTGSADPTATQLAGVSTTKAVSGFAYLGTDDFFTELTMSREPLTSFLPTGYDTTLLTPDPQVNEHGRTVQSAIFPNLKMGLQALAATLKRRRKIFLDEAKTHGYSTPTTKELVYWTYVYYNSGEFNGQLKKFKGRRVLADWITKREYPNAIKVLESWRMISAMAIF